MFVDIQRIQVHLVTIIFRILDIEEARWLHHEAAVEQDTVNVGHILPKWKGYCISSVTFRGWLLKTGWLSLYINLKCPGNFPTANLCINFEIFLQKSY